jgi:hypothetical protein
MVVLVGLWGTISTYLFTCLQKTLVNIPTKSSADLTVLSVRAMPQFDVILGLAMTVLCQADSCIFSVCKLFRCLHNFTYFQISLLARSRVYHFHGEPGARLNADQSVHDRHKQTVSMFIKILSPLLFYAPNFHLSRLQAISIDGLIRPREWPEFLMGLNSEWGEFILYVRCVGWLLL